MRIGGFSETHLCIAAGKNFAMRIGHLQFHLQCARTRIHRARRARDHCFEGAARQFLKRQLGFLAGCDGVDERLRHADIDAQRIGLCEAKQFGAAGGGNELADVRAAQRHRSIKWRGDAIKYFQVFQPLHIRARGFDVRLL